MEAAIAAGTNVVWCLSEPKRQNFFGYRTTHMGYAAGKIAALVKKSDLQVKKGRRMGNVDPDSPFMRYFDSLSQTGWTLCLADAVEGYRSIASTPEGYSLGGRVNLDHTSGWLITPPTSIDAVNQLIRDSIALEKAQDIMPGRPPEQAEASSAADLAQAFLMKGLRWSFAKEITECRSLAAAAHARRSTASEVYRRRDQLQRRVIPTLDTAIL